jgi:pimeloyl-ACP methyl ester carboxylesterase
VSSIVTDQGVVHYEVVGRGRPVILLHGWLGSWGYWVDTLGHLEGHCRGYALDFWGFGDSGKRRDSFHISDFVALVDQFMERMGIDSAPIIGHSMGGTVALSLALAKPKRVEQIIIVGSPIAGKSLSLWLQLAGKPWIASLVWKFPAVLNMFLKLYSYRVTHKPETWYEMIMLDISVTTLESFFSSIRSLYHTDLTPRLADITVPTLGIYGMSDIIVNPHQAKLLSQYLDTSHVAMLAGSGHFPMLDEPDIFNRHILNFLHTGR